MEPISAAGTFLASAPDLMDPNFMHRVVLMCQHSPEGAYGLVVNCPAEVKVSMLMPDHPVLGSCDFPVHSGGPVGLDTLQFVHRVPDRIEGGLEISDGLYLGGELEQMAMCLAAEDEAAATIRLFLGYSGWSAGQLEQELSDGSWLPAPLSVDAVFMNDTHATWREVVRSIGPASEGLENLPPDVSWN